LAGRKIVKKIFEKEIEKEMKWIGIIFIVFILSFTFLLSFAILLIANAVLADIEILKFINK
tara:strand:+ start:358 stop:540 length:183 start_codon:yes stop_codon:yes gene_type:complete